MELGCNLSGHFQQQFQLLDNLGNGQNPYLKAHAIPSSPWKACEMTMANTAKFINTNLESMIISNDDTIIPLESNTLYDEETPLLGTFISSSEMLKNDGVLPAEKRKTPNTLWSEGEIIELIENVYYSFSQLKIQPNWGKKVQWNKISHSTRILQEAKDMYYQIKQIDLNGNPILNKLALRGIRKEDLVELLGFTITDFKTYQYHTYKTFNFQQKRKYNRWTVEEITGLITQLYKQAIETKVFDFEKIHILNRTQSQIAQKYLNLTKSTINPDVLEHLNKYNITENELKILNLKSS